MAELNRRSIVCRSGATLPALATGGSETVLKAILVVTPRIAVVREYSARRAVVDATADELGRLMEALSASCDFFEPQHGHVLTGSKAMSLRLA